jgi:branched-chain amino acid transport system substrate-binding protein
MKRILNAWCLSTLAALAMAGGAQAETVKIGVTVPTTGPAATLGIGARNAISLFPKQIAGYDLDVTILDDASDTTGSVKNAKQFLGDKVDLIVGSSTSPQSLAVIEAIAGSNTPLIALGASARLVSPMDDKRKWVFKTAANDSLMAEAIAEHMKSRGVKKMGFIGFADAYGDSWLAEMKNYAAKYGLEIVVAERFNSKDTSVTGQVLRLMGVETDAILVAGSGTPPALPHATLKERGYKGLIYQTHGAASEDLLRVGGAALNGGLVPVGPNLVWEQLPDGFPTKAPSAKFVPMYESKFGAKSRSNFAAQAYDVLLFLERALPEAGKKAKPGTEEFRVALRDALENIKNLPANAGVFTMTPDDHSGMSKHGRVIVEIQNGAWVLDKSSAQP